MKISEAFSSFGISFEIFPPKTEQGLASLYEELTHLSAYTPEFISVTYGAGGSTRDKTIDLSLEIRKRFGIDPLVHFTCVGAGRDEIRAYLEKVKALGLTNILALRGDPPAGAADFTPAPDGFHYANELVSFIRSVDGFSIAVAGYPEKHPTAPSFEADISNLKKKVDAGAELIITQLFLDNADYFRFVDRVNAAGITVPVIPGIMPIVNAAQIQRMATLSGAKLPPSLQARIDTAHDDAEVMAIGIEHATTQCAELKAAGAKGFHFYPLNKSAAVGRVIRESGILS